MTRSLSDIILEPVITEKSTALSKHSKYTFKVSKGSSKTAIKKAFENIFPDRKILEIQTPIPLLSLTMSMRPFPPI